MGIPWCPHCGMTHETLINCTARGPAEAHYDGTGSNIEVMTGRIYFRRSKVIRCLECGKVRKDVVFNGVGIERRDDG